MKLRLKIDPLALDKEWEEHPEQYGQWSIEFCRTQNEYDEAKAAFELAKAEVEDDIRTSPKDYKIDKITNDVVAAKVVLQPDYKLAQKRLNAARKMVNLAKAALDSLEHKKRALTKLTDLFTHEYYADKKGG